MTVAALIDEMTKFMVPVGPTGQEDPSLGWPDEGYRPPASITGLSLAGSSGNTTLVGSGFSGSLAGGTVSISADATIPGSSATPPTMLATGVVVASSTPTQIVLSQPAEDGSGEQTVTVVATAADQRLFSVDASNVSLVTSVQRISPASDGAVDVSVPGHNLAMGSIGIGAMTPAVAVGHEITIKFRRFSSLIPAGCGYLVTPPRPTPSAADFTVGGAWSTAYGAYFGAGLPAPLPGSYDAAMQAMKTTMDGMSAVPGMGAVALTAGLLAFWGVVTASAATIWPTLTATTAAPPPGVFAAGPIIMATMAPTVLVPTVGPGAGWSSLRSQADVTLMASAIAAVSVGALIITQPGPIPIPVPFVLA
jgi:hypothetical protein